MDEGVLRIDLDYKAKIYAQKSLLIMIINTVTSADVSSLWSINMFKI